MTESPSIDNLEVTPSDSDQWWEEHCSIIPPEPDRLLLVGVVGAMIASISVIFNSFLFAILIRNRRHRASHLIYLTFLSLADALLSAAYILLFPVNIYMDYFDSHWLASAWWSYMRIIITISHVFISTSAFLIVAAAFERYITISKIRTQFANNHRLLISCGAVCFALIAKFPMYFELQIERNGNCTGVTFWTASVAEFSETEPYKTYYKYWFRNIVSIFLPFILCFYLNFEIIRRLRQQHQGAKLFRFATSEHRQNIRSATLMLVFVTFTYLASNVLNVVVYTWELIDKPSLFSEKIRPFYTLSSDLVSLLTVTASCARLPIYIACNARIRCEVLDFMEESITSTWNKPQISSVKKRARPTTIRYCHSGDGFMIYEDNPEREWMTAKQNGESHLRTIGTGLDKVVLSVAMGGQSSRPSSTTSSSRFLEVDEQNDVTMPLQLCRI